MLSDIPEKEWNVLNHKIILLVVVFGCGGDIFMKISKFWIQSNLKNRSCELKNFRKIDLKWIMNISKGGRTLISCLAPPPFFFRPPKYFNSSPLPNFFPKPEIVFSKNMYVESMQQTKCVCILNIHSCQFSSLRSPTKGSRYVFGSKEVKGGVDSKILYTGSRNTPPNYGEFLLLWTRT